MYIYSCFYICMCVCVCGCPGLWLCLAVCESVKNAAIHDENEKGIVAILFVLFNWNTQTDIHTHAAYKPRQLGP